MEFLYETATLAGAFGTHWCGPARLDHAQPTLVARYPATCADGTSVEVFCTAMPALFFLLQVPATEHHPAFHLCTGSGLAGWAADTATLIAAGMVDARAGYPLPSSPFTPINQQE